MKTNRIEGFSVAAGIFLAGCGFSLEDSHHGNVQQQQENRIAHCETEEKVAGLSMRSAFIVPLDSEKPNALSSFSLVTEWLEQTSNRKGSDHARYFSYHEDAVKIINNVSKAEAEAVVNAFCGGGEGALVEHLEERDIRTVPPIAARSPYAPESI